MTDYNELRKKFPAKKPVPRSKAARAAIKSIAREYEMKKAALTGGAPVMKKGFVFYAVVVIGLLLVGSMVLSVCGKGGRTPIPLKPMQARKSMDSLAIALGRFKFHTAAQIYPMTRQLEHQLIALFLAIAVKYTGIRPQDALHTKSDPSIFL